MNLLFKKERTRNSRNGISVTKSTITISGSAINRIINLKTDNYGALGLNEEGNLCFYISQNKHESLFKLWASNKGKGYRLSVNSSSAKKAVTPYIGSYSIKYISVNEKEGVREVVLKQED